MAFRQDQNNKQKQRVSQSPHLIEAIKTNEKSDLEIQDELDLEKITDADLGKQGRPFYLYIYIR